MSEERLMRFRDEVRGGLRRSADDGGGLRRSEEAGGGLGRSKEVAGKRPLGGATRSDVVGKCFWVKYEEIRGSLRRSEKVSGGRSKEV